MAYSDFTALELTRKFGIKFSSEVLFPNAKPIIPSQWLVEGLARGQSLGFGSEKSRSERLVTPILLELNYLHKHRFSIHSGMNLDIDEAMGLKGECDFIFSFSRVQDFVTAPIFCITEAKKQDLEQGTIQCSAQLIGAKRFNELEKNPVKVLYGASTTGIEWRFLKYENNDIIIDENRYVITQLDILLGIFECVIENTTIENR
ncbi:MAG: hypothetical protein EAZ32_14675 [Cytophagia bacterium]|jgi:hypothetical protein|nr:MAG: hypothetical protein EAZ38_15780 [Cytophagales bacterium]TAG37668.1 MAG: hypothetical protein EAZ32_14675 [Cytophagia bacterium]TAG78808.1 MAG: hypothetical protein EAZ22_12845 [Cytophagales bacterium]